MFIAKGSPLMLLSAGAALAACAGPPSSAPSPEVEETLANLVAAGFPEAELAVQGGVVYVGGDAAVSLAASREMLAAPPGDSREQYRASNLVGEAITDICLEGSFLPGLLSSALDEAIINYNSLGLRKRLRRIAGDTAGPRWKRTGPRCASQI